MPARRILLLAVALGFSLVALRPAPGEETKRPALEAKDIDPLLRTDWYGVYLKDKKIGYFRDARARIGATIVESETFNMKLASFGQKSEVLVNQVTTFESQAPYRMLRAEMDQRNDPTPPEKTLLVRQGTGFDYTYRTGQEVSKKRLADIDYTLPDALAPDLWIRGGPKQGDKAQFKQFDIKDAKIHNLASKVLGTKSSLVAGVKVRYFEVENVSSKEQLTFLTRHDDQGRLLSSVIAIFDLAPKPRPRPKTRNIVRISSSWAWSRAIGRSDPLEACVNSCLKSPAKKAKFLRMAHAKAWRWNRAAAGS